jgi:hypothetical protein
MLPIRSRLVHLGVQLDGQLAAAPIQKQRGAAQAVGILGGRDEAYAGRTAALDLVLQAGSAAVAKNAVLAGAQLEQTMDRVQGLAHGDHAGKRAEVSTRPTATAAVEGNAGIGLAGTDMDVGIALVVAQQHVVARPQRLDQLVLQHQRLALAARHGHFDGRDLRNHRRQARLARAAAEVARHPLLQRGGLADVEHGTVGRQHAVDAGLTGHAAGGATPVKDRRRRVRGPAHAHSPIGIRRVDLPSGSMRRISCALLLATNRAP